MTPQHRRVQAMPTHLVLAMDALALVRTALLFAHKKLPEFVHNRQWLFARANPDPVDAYEQLRAWYDTTEEATDEVRDLLADLATLTLCKEKLLELTIRKRGHADGAGTATGSAVRGRELMRGDGIGRGSTSAVFRRVIGSSFSLTASIMNRPASSSAVGGNPRPMPHRLRFGRQFN